MGIDTGNPGFTINGNTYTFDPIPAGAEGVDPIPADSGDINVDNTQRDLSEQTKKVLRNFVTRIVNTNDHNPDNPWAPDLSELQQAINPMIGSQEYADAITETPAHDLLRNIPENQLPQQLSNYTSAILSNNRFTADKVMVGTLTPSPDKFYDPTIYNPKNATLGKWDASDESSTKLKRMAQIGIALTTRASGELNADKEKNPATNSSIEASALLPSANQIGLAKINTELLKVSDILENLGDEEVDNDNLLVVDKSWGSLNNPFDQFSGANALGMVALASAHMAAIIVIVEALSTVIGTIAGKSKRRDANGKLVMGQYMVPMNQSTVSSVTTGILSLTSTVHDYNQCARRGIYAFFGARPSDGILGAISNVVGDLVDLDIKDAGHKVVIARAIIRSSVGIVDAARQLFSGSSANSIIGAAQNALSFIDEIRNSKIIRAIDNFAKLGDQILISEENERNNLNEIETAVLSSPVVAGYRVEDTRKLAWASNRTPSLYLLPSEFVGLSMATKMGGFQSGFGLTEKDSYNMYRISTSIDRASYGSRIPNKSPIDVEPGPLTVNVKQVEDMLEAAYCPFYFHDIRTNEIISFHAFIDSLTDSYSAGYDSSEGFGRVESVKIYKGTTRKFACSFYIVSTSESDFDEMWIKINKLVTLVYPQFTKGRMLSTDNGNYKFTQPFSQMIGASPLIRIRLGNLIRSNYSRFALARLFGAGVAGTVINGKNVEFSNIDIEKRDIILTKMKKNNEGEWRLTTAGLDSANSSSTPINLGVLNEVISSNNSIVFDPNQEDLPYFICKILSDNNDNTCVVLPKIMSIDDMVEFFNYTRVDAAKKYNQLQNKYANQNNRLTYFIGGRYNVSKNDLVPTGQTMRDALAKSIINETTNENNNESAIELSNFLDPEKNAIAKSFKSTQGKGLAGFIESMSFDWLTNVRWDLDPGKKAPTTCKVSIDFSPIHDITPGLDHLGYNRAPIYPVGFMGHGVDDKDAT